MQLPLISVVMPSYNQAEFIDEAIRSVLEQDYPSFELLVIDGASTDGAVEVIRKHSSRLAHWESESDRGQSHAINKGIRKARGDLITWLNSDDVLLPGALRRVGEHYAAGPTGDRWIAGSCLWMEPGGAVIRCAVGNRWWKALAQRGLVNVGGPSSFFSRSLVDRAGLLDEDLHYIMDTELWLRFARQGAAFEQLGQYLWALRLHPAAKMSGHNFAHSPMASPDHPVWKKRAAERRLVAERHAITTADEVWAGRLSRVFRTVTLATPKALIDTWRLRGRSWKSCAALEDPRDPAGRVDSTSGP